MISTSWWKDGPCQEAAVADGCGSALVGGAFRGEPDGGSCGVQRGVAVGGEFGGCQEVVVATRVVGPLVGEEGFSFDGAEAARHRGGDDDPVGPAGRGVRVLVRRVDDA